MASPYFEFCHFLRRTPLIESLQFVNCLHFDCNSFVTSVAQTELSKLRVLDLHGTSTVSSMDLWEISKHVPNVSKLFVEMVVSDIFAEEIFLNLPNLTHFDCFAPGWCLTEWRQLMNKFPWFQLGPDLRSWL